MRKSPFVRVITMVAVVALVGWLASDTAAMQDGKGNITGMLKTHDDKPAASFNIKLTQDQPVSVGRPGRGKGKSGGWRDWAPGPLQGSPGGGKARIIATTTTDAQGKFAFNNVKCAPEGSAYRLEGGNKNTGWIYYDVIVRPNQTTEVNDLKLAKLD
jgi:hypothetical protein